MALVIYLGGVGRSRGDQLLMLVVKLRRAQPTARLWIAGFALASPLLFAFTMSQRSGRAAPALASLP